MIDKRKCFIFDGEVQEIKARQVVTTEEQVIIAKDEIMSVDIPQLMDKLMDITDAYPALSNLDTLKNVFPEVCPQSLLDDDINGYLAMESFCREYKVAPLGDIGYLDYPISIIEVFGIIGLARDRIQMKELKEVGQKNG